MPTRHRSTMVPKNTQGLTLKFKGNKVMTPCHLKLTCRSQKMKIIVVFDLFKMFPNVKEIEKLKGIQ